MLARKERKRLYKKAKKNIKLAPEAGLAKHKVKTLINNAKATSWKKLCSNLDIKTNSREVWNKINAFRGKKSKMHIPSINGGKTKQEKIDNI